MRRWFDRASAAPRSLVPRRPTSIAALERELQLHLEEQIAENVAAGMSPAEARAAALRAFGPVAAIEEECRDTRRVAFVENLRQDLRYTLRSLARQPLLVAAATLSIAVAVGANTTIFSLATELLLCDAHRRAGPIGSCTSGWGTAATSRTAVARSRRQRRARRGWPAIRSRPRSTGAGQISRSL